MKSDWMIIKIPSNPNKSIMAIQIPLNPIEFDWVSLNEHENSIKSQFNPMNAHQFTIQSALNPWLDHH